MMPRGSAGLRGGGAVAKVGVGVVVLGKHE